MNPRLIRIVTSQFGQLQGFIRPLTVWRCSFSVS
jgi:hypothetical protein